MASRGTKPRGLRPTVEAIEARLLLSGASVVHHDHSLAEVSDGAMTTVVNSNRTYLTYLEGTFTHGTLAPARDAALDRKLNLGVPRPRVVAELLRSPEYASALASDAYRASLN